MIKTSFQKELKISATQSKDNTSNAKKDVLKIQSWLNLFALVNPSSGTATNIDGDFGTATEKSVKNFQKFNNLQQTGICDQTLFNLLTKPMLNAFTSPGTGKNLRTLICNTAAQHLKNNPYELIINNQSNSGPWVRAYMDGQEGSTLYWCMGFVQTIIDQAASQLDKDFRSIMPLTYSCDTVGVTGLHTGNLFRYTAIRKDPSIVKPGDIFLLQKSPNDWFHTGLITSISDQLFETIEGNTNMDGSNNGNGVYKRLRNFAQSKLDVFSIEGLV